MAAKFFVHSKKYIYVFLKLGILAEDQTKVKTKGMVHVSFAF